jgi:hypothetical protein
MSRSSTANETEAPWRAGLHSARALLWPGLFLQATALALVLAYYFLPAAQPAFAQVGEWQRNGGYGFSVVATVLCGAVVPFLFLRLHPDTRAAHPWPHLLFFLLFWAWKGAEVDLWYRTLAWMYGDGNHVSTIARKVLTDQFVFNPVYSTPISIPIFAWKDAGFRWAPVVADLRTPRWYYRRVIPVLLPLWCIWFPVVICVYSLPLPLQMPLFNVVLCFWSMLFAHVTSPADRDGGRRPET